MFTDHFDLKYLVNQPVLGGKICHWLLLFQEFDFEIIVHHVTHLQCSSVLHLSQFTISGPGLHSIDLVSKLSQNQTLEREVSNNISSSPT